MAEVHKKGGVARIIVTDVQDGQVISLPKGFMVDKVITKKIGTTAGNMAIGTTVGDYDLVLTSALGTVNGALASQTLSVAYPLSLTADTPLYFTKSTALATYDAYVIIKKVN